MGGNYYKSGNGGIGFLSAINGTSYYWGGGGGGSGWYNTGGNGGAGGGGGGATPNSAGSGGAGLNNGASGGSTESSNGGAGGANTGGGGGGGTHAYSTGGAGGSGIVIIRYYGSQKATGGTVTSSGGYTIHTFTSSGTFTPTAFLDWSDASKNKIRGIPDGITYNSGNRGYFSFDGVNDFLDTNYSAGDVSTPTFEAWVYDTKNNGSYRAIIQNNTASDDALYKYPSNVLGFWPCTASSLTIPANEWAYVAMAYNGSSMLYCVNGTFQTVNSSCADCTDFDFLRVGGWGTGDGERWQGRIAMARVWRRALTQEELLRSFNSTRSRFGV
jgi:hypothetical protein